MTASTVHYMPILKGRMGELRALRELGTRHSHALTPLIEIPLAAADIDTDDVDVPASQANSAKFADDLSKNVGTVRRLIFDASQAPVDQSGQSASAHVLSLLLAEGLDATPTVRPSDDENDIASLRFAMKEWKTESACIRLAGEDLDPDDRSLAESVGRLLAGLGSPSPRAVDLVVDLGALADDQAGSFASHIARLVLSEIPSIGEWRTLTLASGGFPPDLNSVQPEVLTEIPRRDAVMWRAVAGRVRTPELGFGDYAVGYPAQTLGVGFAPAPQLRWTVGDSWLIYKGRKRDRLGSKQFYDICRRMVDAGAVDRGLSWGDEYVADAAGGEDSGRTTGNAMIWRALGTSHHLNYLVSRLATHGAP